MARGPEHGTHRGTEPRARRSPPTTALVCGRKRGRILVVRTPAPTVAPVASLGHDPSPCASWHERSGRPRRGRKKPRYAGGRRSLAPSSHGRPVANPTTAGLATTQLPRALSSSRGSEPAPGGADLGRRRSGRQLPIDEGNRGDASSVSDWARDRAPRPLGALQGIVRRTPPQCARRRSMPYDEQFLCRLHVGGGADENHLIPGLDGRVAARHNKLLAANHRCDHALGWHLDLPDLLS